MRAAVQARATAHTKLRPSLSGNRAPARKVSGGGGCSTCASRRPPPPPPSAAARIAAAAAAIISTQRLASLACTSRGGRSWGSSSELWILFAGRICPPLAPAAGRLSFARALCAANSLEANPQNSLTNNQSSLSEQSNSRAPCVCMRAPHTHTPRRGSAKAAARANF